MSSSFTSLREHGGAVLLQLAEPEHRLVQLPVQAGEGAVAQLGGPLVVQLLLRPLELRARGLDLRLELAHLPFRSFSFFQRAVMALRRSFSSESSRSISIQALRRGGVVLLPLQGLALHLELGDPPVHLVHPLRHGVDLHAQAGRRLVHQVDGLVGEEAVRDVAVRERGRRHQGGVRDLDLVVDLVALLQAAQDGDGVLHRGLAHHDGLEAALQGRVLLDVLAVLVEGGGPDAAQLAAGQRGLEQVGGVHRALGGAGAHQGVQLVDEKDDPPLRLLDLPAAPPSAGPRTRRGTWSPRSSPRGRGTPARLFSQRLGHVAVGDAPGHALHDRGLAHARARR